jgi:ankyrin repeat protein
MASRHAKVTLLLTLCMATVVFTAAPPERRLVDAVQQGDKDSIRTLLKQKVDVNAPQGDGMTALHWAAFHEDADTAALLIGAGANVKATTRIGAITPLLIAAKNGNALIVKALLDAGADANSATADGATALMTAAISGNAGTVAELLNHGANVNATERAHSQTALMFAAAENRAAVIAVLAAHGADLKAATTVVHLDEEKLDDNGNPIPKKETEAGGTVTGGNTMMGGMTALLFASRNGQLDAVRALVDAGADVNQISAGDHSSPLVIAVANSHYEVGKYLVDHGANPNIANVDGLTPLYATIDMQYAPVSWAPNPLTVQEKVSHLDLIKDLLAKGADPNAKLTRKLWFRPTSHNQQWISTVGSTPFWRAAQGTDVPAMRTLVAGGADPKIATNGGTTALMVAAGLGYAGNFSQQMPDSWIPAVQYCLDVGLDINAADGQGYTALHGAAYRGDNDLVKFLVSKGAKLDARNKRGWSVTDMANAPSLRSSVPLAHPDTIALLLEMGAPPLTAIEGETLLGSGRKRPAAPKVSPEIAGYATWMKTAATANTSLKKSVEGKQAAAVAMDAQTMADLFGQIEAYWAKSNTADAIALSRSAHDASLDLAAAAQAGNWEKADAAMKTIGGTCSACHTAHRDKQPDGAYTIKK